MNGIEFLDWLVLMCFAFALGSFVATVMLNGRRTHNMPCGPSIKTRPLRDLESLLKLAKEKDEE